MKQGIAASVGTHRLPPDTLVFLHHAFAANELVIAATTLTETLRERFRERVLERDRVAQEDPGIMAFYADGSSGFMARPGSTDAAAGELRPLFRGGVEGA